MRIFNHEHECYNSSTTTISGTVRAGQADAPSVPMRIGKHSVGSTVQNFWVGICDFDWRENYV